MGLHQIGKRKWVLAVGCWLPPSAPCRDLGATVDVYTLGPNDSLAALNVTGFDEGVNVQEPILGAEFKAQISDYLAGVCPFTSHKSQVLCVNWAPLCLALGTDKEWVEYE